MILKGYIGTVYVRLDETSRIDLWRTDVWLKPGKALDEILDAKSDILEQLAANSEDFSEYDTEEGEGSPENTDSIETFHNMIDDIRSRLNEDSFDDSYEDVEVNISSVAVHIPQLTEYEWARICENQAI